MGSTLYVFGVEIPLTDHASLVTADATIGLYNITSDLSKNVGSATTTLNVDDGSVFTEGETATLRDDLNSETVHVNSVTGNVVKLTSSTSGTSYTQANNARLDANSRFRWVQQAIDGVSGWCATMLVPKGIGAWTRQIDLRRGGNIATPGTCSATVKNTSKFWDSLADASIYLNGLVFNVYEFQGSTKSRVWWGICEKPKWDAKKYTVPAKGGYNRRKANLGTIITEADYPDAQGDDVLG